MEQQGNGNSERPTTSSKAYDFVKPPCNAVPNTIDVSQTTAVVPYTLPESLIKHCERCNRYFHDNKAFIDHNWFAHNEGPMPGFINHKDKEAKKLHSYIIRLIGAKVDLFEAPYTMESLFKGLTIEKLKKWNLKTEYLNLELTLDHSAIAVETMGYKYVSTKELDNDKGYVKLKCEETSCKEFMIVFGKHTHTRIDPMLFVRNEVEDGAIQHNHAPFLKEENTIWLSDTMVRFKPEDPQLQFEHSCCYLKMFKFYPEFDVSRVKDTSYVPSKKSKPNSPEDQSEINWNRLVGFKCEHPCCPWMIFQVFQDNNPKIKYLTFKNSRHSHNVTCTYPGPAVRRTENGNGTTISLPAGVQSKLPELQFEWSSNIKSIDVTTSITSNSRNASGAIDYMASHITAFSRKNNTGPPDVKSMLKHGCIETEKVYKVYARKCSPSSTIPGYPEQLGYCLNRQSLKKLTISHSVTNFKLGQKPSTKKWTRLCSNALCFLPAQYLGKCSPHSHKYECVTVLKLKTETANERLKPIYKNHGKNKFVALKVISFGSHDAMPNSVIAKRHLQNGLLKNITGDEYEVLHTTFFKGEFASEYALRMVNQTRLIIRLMAYAVNGNQSVDFTLVPIDTTISIYDKPSNWEFFHELCKEFGLYFSFEDAEMFRSHCLNKTVEEIQIRIEQLSKVGDLSTDDSKYTVKFGNSDSALEVHSEEVSLYALSVGESVYVGVSDSGKEAKTHTTFGFDTTEFGKLRRQSLMGDYCRHLFAVGPLAFKHTFESSAILALFLGVSKGLVWKRESPFEICRRCVNKKLEFLEMSLPESTRLLNTFSCKFFNRLLVLHFDQNSSFFKNGLSEKGVYDLPIHKNGNVIQCDSSLK